MKGIKTPITPEQEQWLRLHYPDSHNRDCLAALGWQPNQWRTLRRVAKRLGLEKSDEFMTACQAHTAQCAAAANRYDGNSGIRNLIIYGEPYRFRAGETNLQRLGPEREARRLQKAHASRRETIRKERRRLLFGLPQQTKIKLTGGGNKRMQVRYNLRKRGYHVARGANVAYYDDNTQRTERLERWAAREHVNVEPANTSAI